MSMRRPLLVAAVLAMASTAPTRVRASVEAEGAGYAGTTAGGWVCGPVARANYAGGAARVRYAEHAGPFGGSGAVAEVAAAVEREETELIECDLAVSINDEPAACDPEGSVLPPTTTMAGGHVRAGYQWEQAGLEAGGSLYQYYTGNGDSGPSLHAFPDLEVTVGAPTSGRFLVGFGTPLLTTLRRPGAYLGGDFPLGPVEARAQLGAFRAGPGGESARLRMDAVAHVPLTPHLDVRLGGSLGSDDGGAAGEGSVGIRGKL